MSTADIEGPPSPDAFRARMLSLILDGEIVAARDLAAALESHFHSHRSPTRNSSLDAFYLQGIKHALEMVEYGRERRSAMRSRRAKPVLRQPKADLSPNSGEGPNPPRLARAAGGSK